MKEKSKKISRQSKGITLISLVITIIVLLILAGVSIAMLTGENGILTQATKAGEETARAEAEEKVTLAILGSYDNTGKVNEKTMVEELFKEGATKITGADGSDIPSTTTDILDTQYPIKVEMNGYEVEVKKPGETSSGGTTPPTTTPSIEDAKTVLSETENTVVEDTLGNSVKIPAGFKVSDDSGADVTEGIVVEDSIGNQFVWIPVGTIKTDNSGGKEEIKLSRYEFDENGAATIKGLTEDVNSEGSYNTYDYLEEQTSTEGNTVATDLNNGFITKTEASGGYYIARYEASEGTNGKVESGKNKEPWIYITQPNAAIEAREMYTSDKYRSDLINSLAWDTAIVYIQTFSEDPKYSMQTTLNTSLLRTGQSGDVKCNIYDMGSNVYEWSTETSRRIGDPCVGRGAVYGGSNYPSSGRFAINTTYNSNTISFRPILYL